MENGFWIGIIVAVIAVFSISFRNRRKTSFKTNNNKIFLFLGIASAIIGIIGYTYLGWRF